MDPITTPVCTSCGKTAEYIREGGARPPVSLIDIGRHDSDTIHICTDCIMDQFLPIAMECRMDRPGRPRIMGLVNFEFDIRRIASFFVRRASGFVTFDEFVRLMPNVFADVGGVKKRLPDARVDQPPLDEAMGSELLERLKAAS